MTFPQQASRSGALGLVFTDARGRVAFGDNNFLQLTSQTAGTLVGEPLYRVLRADQPSVEALIREIAQTGHVHDHLLEIKASGKPITVIFSGAATFDEKGIFIGADLTLRDASSGAGQAGPTTHGDVLSARIQQIEGEAALHEEQERAIILLYFAAQASAIHILLTRMGGPRVSEALEGLVNALASKNKWPLKLTGGHFVADPQTMPPEACRPVLDEIIAYGASIVGHKTIVAEMQMVDSRMSDLQREAGEQAGLRIGI